MYGWDAIMLPPIVRHLIRQLAVPSQLVKEEFRVKLPSLSVLVDLLDVQGSLGAVRVRDLEVDGVDRTFTIVIRDRQLLGPRRRYCRTKVVYRGA